MLTVLLTLRSFCEKWCINNATLNLTEEQWEAINEITISLEPSMRAMSKLQSESITLTDCRKFWEMCHIQTAELGEYKVNKLNSDFRVAVLLANNFYIEPFISKLKS